MEMKQMPVMSAMSSFHFIFLLNRLEKEEKKKLDFQNILVAWMPDRQAFTVYEYIVSSSVNLTKDIRESEEVYLVTQNLDWDIN